MSTVANTSSTSVAQYSSTSLQDRSCFAVTQSINAQQFLCLIDCISNCDDYMCIPVLCGSFLRDCSNNRIFGLCRYPGYMFSRLAACWHAGFVRTFLITERVIICVAICVCTVLILRDWSHDHLLIHFARANRSRKFSDMFGETRLIHRSQFYGYLLWHQHNSETVEMACK